MKTRPPLPNDKKWEPMSASEDASDACFYFLLYYIPVGFFFSALAIGASFALMWVTDFPLSRVLSSTAWDILLLMLLLGVVLVLHESFHALFANWPQVRIKFDAKYGAIAAQLGGEMSKWRFILCCVAPTIIISGVGMPLAFHLANPYLMAAAILNLGLAGVDWSTTIKILILVKGSRVYCDGEKMYVPRDRATGEKKRIE